VYLLPSRSIPSDIRSLVVKLFVFKDLSKIRGENPCLVMNWYLSRI